MAAVDFGINAWHKEGAVPLFSSGLLKKLPYMELKVEKINEMPRFSVVVPVYNGEKYLPDSLESASSQV